MAVWIPLIPFLAVLYITVVFWWNGVGGVLQLGWSVSISKDVLEVSFTRRLH